jgi:predicted nucleic-acid-binding protein
MSIENNIEEEEKEEQIEPPSNPNLLNDKEVSIEASSFINLPLEKHYKPQASFLECLKELSYAKIPKDLCIQACKSRNHLPKKILLSKQVGYLR